MRFFDRWLKGIPNGADEEPAITWFEREYAEPEPFPAVWPGRWRAANAYPHPATVADRVAVPGRIDCHWSAGLWRAGTRAIRRPVSIATRIARRSARVPRCRGAPAARRTAWDATCGRTRRSARPTPRSRSRRAVEILGVPEVVLHLSVSAPVATAVVRLTDVAPDGTSAQVTAGILNLTHRRSHDAPEPLEPGRVEEIRVAMRPAGYRFLPGPSHPRLGRLVGLAGRLAVAVPGRPSSSTAAARPRRG